MPVPTTTPQPSLPPVAVATSSRQPDILKVGDRISYYNPVFVAGNPDGFRETTILAIQPIPLSPSSNIDYYPLELDNAEVLPSDLRVKRLITGRDQPIEDFELFFRTPLFRDSADDPEPKSLIVSIP